jgi:methionyl-tRNA formyltransferase
VKLIFAGTPEFAAASLEALLAAGHDVALVLTQPDRPAGRGMKRVPGPVKALAQSHGIALRQPATLKDPAERDALDAVGADVMVVAAYGLILPEAVLNIPRHGCINVHASLLPRWRGAAPIQRAILAGDAQTGVTIMQMNAGLDTGDLLLSAAIPITRADTAGTLEQSLARLGAECIVRALGLLAEGVLPSRPQPETGATYAPKIAKREAAIDWSRNAAELDRAIRAFNPFPGAVTELDGTAIKIWQAAPSEQEHNGRSPGRVIGAGREGIVVACAEGALRLEVLQRPGGKRLDAAAFLAGFPIAPGACFGKSDA